jgi:hypothetical protein
MAESKFHQQQQRKERERSKNGKSFFKIYLFGSVVLAGEVFSFNLKEDFFFLAEKTKSRKKRRRKS